MRRLITRHQPLFPCACWFKAGLGGGLGIALVAWLAQVSGQPFLIAPLGASAVLLYAAPSSPLAQPANVVGGHVLAAVVSLILRDLLPMDWWSVGLAVGVVMGLMVALRLTHPPAGADPIVVFMTDPGSAFLFAPILGGSLLLVALAFVLHRLPPRTAYPLSAAPPPPDGLPTEPIDDVV
ncbi:MAG: HPP family protein [Rhodobacterales bacterium]|nr:HPP family protein [Rhodobacterales bacterium]